MKFSFKLYLLVLFPALLFGQGSGNTLTFNGGNEAIDLGDQVANNARTIEMWFKPYITITSALADPVTLIARDFDNSNGLSTNEFSVCFYPAAWGGGGKLNFVRRIGSALFKVESDSDFWLADHWYHVAVTIHPGSGMKMYINGVLQQSTDPSNNPIGPRSGNDSDKVSIGKWGNLPIRYFSGEIDEVRIWEIERSEVEVQREICSKLNGDEFGLKAYYRFDNVSGNTLVDSSLNNFDGTLLNMVDTNRVYSGAPLGDTSTYLYDNTNLSGQTLALNTGLGDQLSVRNITSTSKGVHLYKVNALPNSLNNITDPLTGNYYGVFLTDISGTFDALYDHSAYSCSSCNTILSRNDNAVLSWTNVNGVLNGCSYELSNESTIGYDYRGEFILNEEEFEVDLGKDTALCSGETLTLDATTLGATSYSWQDGSANSTLAISGAGIYWVEVINSCGVTRDTILVSAASFLSGGLGQDTTICPGETLTLDAASFGATYLWQDNSTDSTFVVSSAGMYWVELTDICGLTIDTIEVTFDSPLLIDLGEDTVLCSGEILVLDATTSGASNYVWQDGSIDSVLTISEAGVYWVELSNDCATVSDTIYINSSSFLSDVLGPDTTLCVGEVLTLDATNSGSNYLWQDNSTDSIFLVLEEGMYWVEIMDACGSTADTIEVLFDSSLLTGLDLGADTTLCAGETLTLDAMTIGGVSYLWQDNSMDSTLAVMETGMYSVQVFDRCNSPVSDTIALEFVDLSLELNLGANQTLCYGDLLILDATTENGVEYFWQDSTQLPTLTVTSGGVYTVRVSNECEEIISEINVIEDDCCRFYIPNVFTPNFDGINDEFSVFFSSESCNVTSFSLKIFDRWGEAVFETSDPNESWDGFFLGQQAHLGVYAWIVEFVSQGERHLEKGDLTIVRYR